LWSQHYDRPYKDLFALQDDITRSVADALKAKLLDGGGAVVQSERPPSGNLDAWNAWSRGRFHDAMVNAADARKAIGFYEQATALDPHYARAYASLAVTWTTLGGTFLSGEEKRQAYVKARAAADEALRLDPNVASAHAARGMLLQWADFDLTGAEAEFRRAVELAPADSLSRFTLARMSGTLGHAQQAIALLRQVITIDPRYGGAWNWLGWYLAAIGQFEEAAQAASQAVAFVLGLPINMDGSEGPRAQSTRAFARNFSNLTGLAIALWDERLSTAAVERELIGMDVSRARRAEVIDEHAAIFILQGALDRLTKLRGDA